MVAILAIVFAAAVLALVFGALLFLSEERARRDPTDMRYRNGQRR